MKNFCVTSWIVGLILLESSIVYASNYCCDNSFFVSDYDMCISDLYNDTCHKWYVYSDYLYLNACRSHLDYAIDFDDGSNTDLFVLGKINSVNDQWNSGFRVSLGYRYTETIDFQARFTSFQSTEKFTDLFEYRGGATRVSHILGVPVGNDAPIRNFTRYAAEANPQYQLKYSVLDFDIRANERLTCDLDILYYLGARIAWIYEDMNTLYSEDRVGLTFSNVLQSAHTHGYGVMTGFDFRYRLCNGFHAVTHAAVGALYGMTDYHTINNYINPSEPTRDAIYADVHGHDCLSIFSSEISAGLALCFFRNNRMILELSAGYELHNWHGFADFLNFENNSTVRTCFARDEGSLLLHGLFAKLEMSF